MITHNNDEEVQDSPEAGKVFRKAESHPLDQHLGGEDDCVENVQEVEDLLQHRLLVQVDVLKALQPRNQSLVQMSDPR